MPLPPDILVNKQTNNQTENTLRILHVCTCSFQTCLITDRVESFQQRDDLSSATSLSAGSFALAAHLKKQCWVLLHVDTMSVYWTKNFTLYAMPHFFFSNQIWVQYKKNYHLIIIVDSSLTFKMLKDKETLIKNRRVPESQRETSYFMFEIVLVLACQYSLR